MSHACILNEVFSNLVYMLDESKTAKNTKYFELVLNSYNIIIIFRKKVVTQNDRHKLKIIFQ